jgi:very-short-patch-repair endonuclease
MDVLRKGSVGTTADWYAAGLSEWHLKSLVQQGLLVRIHHGVYATAAALARDKEDPRHEQALLVAAARAATSRDAVASYDSAALMHGIQLLARPPRGSVTLTRPIGGRRGCQAPSGITIRACELPPEHVTMRFKIPVTTAARTVADLARSSSFLAAVVAADSALRQSQTTKPEVAEVLASCPKWPGLCQARRVAEFSDARSESVLESCARVVFHEHRLPAPDLQVELGAERFAGRVDFYWRDYLTIAEADGELKYSTKERSIAQLERDQELRAAGFRVVHFTWQQLFHEQLLVISWIKQAFRGEIS